MKVHFFDKGGNFLYTEEMEAGVMPRLRRLKPLEMEELSLDSPSEFIRVEYQVFESVPISRRGFHNA